MKRIGKFLEFVLEKSIGAVVVGVLVVLALVSVLFCTAEIVEMATSRNKTPGG